ncbi:MAG: HPr kinase/phosphatase C-terminal domain-containing protein [Lactobacillales bacterium]|jgi:HPr kinase/phosphorylase|nr:HPr kinase/phosphatase C-terminal domain-containing protein [Lactobacillales bacterium]
MTETHSLHIHATCISYHGRAFLIMGESGAGKSTLALRLILDRGCVLISDDQTVLDMGADGQVYASAPAALQGKIEVRSVGILQNQKFIARAKLAGILELWAEKVERLPMEMNKKEILGCSFPYFALYNKGEGVDVAAYIAIRVMGGQETVLSL